MNYINSFVREKYSTVYNNLWKLIIYVNGVAILTKYDL